MNSKSLIQILVAIFFFSTVIFLKAVPATAQTVKIKMGAGSSPPILDSITPYVAVEAGFFKKYGLDVQMVELRGDVVVTQALVSGELDLCANIGATSAMVSASKGAKLRLWVVPQPVTPYHLVARKQAGTTIKGLAGKTVAVSGVGAISYHIPHIIMERNGVDPDKLQYVVVGSNADRFRALIAGKAESPWSAP